jgi:hypothetical protein
VTRIVIVIIIIIIEEPSPPFHGITFRLTAGCHGIRICPLFTERFLISIMWKSQKVNSEHTFLTGNCPTSVGTQFLPHSVVCVFNYRNRELQALHVPCSGGNRIACGSLLPRTAFVCMRVSWRAHNWGNHDSYQRWRWCVDTFYLSLSPSLSPSLSLSLTHTHTHTHSKRSERMQRFIGCIQEAKANRPSSDLSWTPGSGVHRPEHLASLNRDKSSVAVAYRGGRCVLRVQTPNFPRNSEV